MAITLDARLLAVLVAHAGQEQANGLSYQELYQAARADGWEGFSKRWKNEAMDEFGHAQNWLKYIAKYNARAGVAPLPMVKDAPISVVDMAIVAAELEAATENSMRAVLAVAQEVGDGAAEQWVGEKLLDQQKSRKQADDFAARVKDAAGEPGSLTIIDRKLERGVWK